MEKPRYVRAASSPLPPDLARKQVENSAIAVISKNRMREKASKRRKVLVELEEDQIVEKIEDGSSASMEGTVGFEKACDRLDDFEWDKDEEEFLAAMEFEDDAVSTTTNVGSEMLSNPIATCCGCPEPVQDNVKTYVDSHNRYVVTKFLYSCLERGFQAASTAYSIKDQRSSKAMTLLLRDAWARSPTLTEGTLINIVDVEPNEKGVFILERNKGFLVVEPDRLISVTNVASTSWCERKVAFSERIRFPIDNIDTLRGTIAHELISGSLKKRLQLKAQISLELSDVLRNADIVEKAYGLGLSQKTLKDMGQELVDWVLLFMKERVISPNRSQKWRINKVRDIEDCYWNPEFGLKGKIDCSVEVNTENGEKMVVPLEFKTGNPRFNGKSHVQVEHIGQVQLYTLLMRNSLGWMHNNGILHYIRENHLVEYSGALKDLQALIMARNRVVFNTPLHGKEGPFALLPGPAGVDFNVHCKRCEYRSICAVSVKLKNSTSGNDEETPEIEQKLEDSIGYLSETELEFFDKWLRVINLEADEDEKSFDSKNLWLKSITQREMEGKCIGDLHLVSQDREVTSTVLAAFTIPHHKRDMVANIFERDFIVLGTEKDPCVCFGTVETITNKAITIAIERKLSERYTHPEITFTMDKIVSSSAGMMQFVYLSRLMEDTPTASRIRSYVIGKKQPVFAALSRRKITAEHSEIFSQYNHMQRSAMMKSLSTDSFLLVKGSPGCGKTHTIVGLIRLLVARKKSVIISAYTSNAVDNILLSYKQHSTDFIRIGSGGKLKQDELAEHSTSALRKKASDVDTIGKLYDSTPVVATTLLSLKHPIFKTRKFDYCIIDEGSQALPTHVFGILMLAQKCVIFGDPNQLPATIKSREVKRMGIEDSMFSLCPTPENTCDLSIQYRMNQYIMKLANELLYRNQMKCASDSQAMEYMVIDGDKVKKYLLEKIPLDKTRKWLCISASRRPERSVLFFDTENINAFEEVVSSTLQNRREKDIVLSIIPVLMEGGILADDIGIIAPYRGQVYLLRESLMSLGLAGIEVNTVDQYQGREKNIIIVSLTKSLKLENERSASEEGILNDIRRLNVAITRARAKVILIGNSRTLKKSPACNRMLSLLSDIQQYKFSAHDFYSEFFKDCVDD